MAKMLRDDMFERLKRLDEDASLLYGGGGRYKMIIVGGSALILMEHIDRTTRDIDVLSASGELYGLMERYDMNDRVKTFINNFPYNYEDRLTLVYKGEAIDFFTASLEDIVIAKLFAYRDNDLVDIESPDVLNAIDWDKLERLAEDDDEVFRNILSDRNYDEFRFFYKKYMEEYRP